MSHYSDSYAYDRQQERKRKNEELTEALEHFKQMKLKAHGILPQRYIDNIDDIINYCKVNIEKGVSNVLS
jgi:hypothetical protein